VLVSGILSVSGPPGRIVEAVFAGDLEPAFDAQIRAEYEEVLGRDELGFDLNRVRVLLDAFDSLKIEVSVSPWSYRLPDPDDSPFLAIAAGLECSLVTGNLRHFPKKSRGGVVVLSSRELMDLMAAGR
jgi:predicted nucleic acid-binding protein